jgi:hypothetical protein
MLRQRLDRLPNEGRMLTSSLEEIPGDPQCRAGLVGQCLTSAGLRPP